MRIGQINRGRSQNAGRGGRHDRGLQNHHQSRQHQNVTGELPRATAGIPMTVVSHRTSVDLKIHRRDGAEVIATNSVGDCRVDCAPAICYCYYPGAAPANDDTDRLG
jgi:hypothetical protein